MKDSYLSTIQLPTDGEDNKYPVIFALHGIGYNEQFMLDLVADLKEEYILIGIRGDLSYEDGYAYYYLRAIAGNPEGTYLIAALIS